MTNYKSNEKPDLDIILQDKENYPVLFEKISTSFGRKIYESNWFE